MHGIIDGGSKKVCCVVEIAAIAAGVPAKVHCAVVIGSSVHEMPNEGLTKVHCVVRVTGLATESQQQCDVSLHLELVCLRLRVCQEQCAMSLDL